MILDSKFYNVTISHKGKLQNYQILINRKFIEQAETKDFVPL